MWGCIYGWMLFTLLSKKYPLNGFGWTVYRLYITRNNTYDTFYPDITTALKPTRAKLRGAASNYICILLNSFSLIVSSLSNSSKYSQFIYWNEKMRFTTSYQILLFGFTVQCFYCAGPDFLWNFPGSIKLLGNFARVPNIRWTKNGAILKSALTFDLLIALFNYIKSTESQSVSLNSSKDYNCPLLN